jgi:hypothetical protein
MIKPRLFPMWAMTTGLSTHEKSFHESQQSEPQSDMFFYCSMAESNSNVGI